MGKIKNWSKLGGINDYPIWKNDEMGFKLKIKQDDVMPRFYTVVGKSREGVWTQMKSITGGNPLWKKQDAIDLAIRWMRNHPNG